MPGWFHVSLGYVWIIISMSMGGTALCHMPLANPNTSAGQSPHFQRLTRKNLACSSRQFLLNLEDPQGLEFDWTILILLPFAEILTRDPVAMGTLCDLYCHSIM